MKTFSFMLMCLLSLSTAVAQTLPEGTPAQTNVPEMKYPCVDNSSRATFKIKAPEAQNVQVDICGKKWPMTKDAQGE